MRNVLFRPALFRSDIDFGLLLLRLFIGLLMMLGHGMPKLTGYSERMSTFADPLGVSSPASLTLAIFAEVFCSAALIFGFLTRFAAAVLLINMLVIALIVHGGDPWAKQEFALLFAIPYLALIFTGAGRFSLDAIMFTRNRTV